MERLAVLKKVFVFSDLEENILVELSKELKERRFKPQDQIFKENDPAGSFFVIDSGRVTIAKQLGAEEKVLAVLGPGNVFGEMAFFSDSPRTAAARANTDSVLWEIKREDFLRFVSGQPKAGLLILSALLRVAMDRLEQTSRELATIYHTGNIISSGRTMPEIASGIKDEILLAIPDADGGAVYLYNEFNQEYDPISAPTGAISIPPTHTMVQALKVNLSGVIIGKCDGNGGLKFLKNCKSILLAPVIKEKKLLGFIVLWNVRKENVFKGSQTLLVSSVGSQLAEAIENIRYHQEEEDRKRLNQAKETYE